MITNTQRSFIWNTALGNVPNELLTLVHKASKTMAALVSPENTAENGREVPLRFRTGNRKEIKGKIKAFFWILNSISIALLVGQLG